MAGTGGGGLEVRGGPPWDDGGAVEDSVRMSAMPDRAARAENIRSWSDVRVDEEGGSLPIVALAWDRGGVVRA